MDFQPLEKEYFSNMKEQHPIQSSEMILNQDGSIFHLQLRPGQLSDTIILVGDPNRVRVVKEFLTNVEHLTQNREYVSTTGMYNGKRISVVSTGVGAGNVDIVLNEIDALFNVDFDTRLPKKAFQKLRMVRIGTSGGLQAAIDINAFVLSKMAVGLDNLLRFYRASETVIDDDFSAALQSLFEASHGYIRPYAVAASNELLEKLYSKKTHLGVTLTAPGFYGAQGREIRLLPEIAKLNDQLSAFVHNGLKITNYEMEAAPIFGLARLLGHEAVAICLIVANRMNKNLNDGYRDHMRGLIQYVLEKIT